MKKEWLVKTLALGIVVLFVGAGIVSAFNVNLIDEFKILGSGNILYVGGVGPDNYTSIQDAINDSYDGDTVYVYNDSSPYFESVVIDKSIYLVGEDKYSTVIDVQYLESYAISVEVDNVWLGGFTVQNANYSGLFIQSNWSVIVGNIIQFNRFGVILIYCDYNVIQSNFIINNTYDGIYFLGKNNCIVGNYIAGNHWGVTIEGAFNNNVSFNTVCKNSVGIYLFDFCRNNTFYKNNITNSDIGMVVEMSSKNYVIQNNFINNDLNARFARCPVAEYFYRFLFVFIYKNKYILDNYKVMDANYWVGNFWNESYVFPYPIFGRRGLFGTVIIIDEQFVPNRIVFDMHPAKGPYVIPNVM